LSIQRDNLDRYFLNWCRGPCIGLGIGGGRDVDRMWRRDVEGRALDYFQEAGGGGEVGSQDLLDLSGEAVQHPQDFFNINPAHS